MYFIKNHDMNVTGCSRIEKNGQGIVWGVLHVLIYKCEKNQKITAYSCLCPATVTWWQTIKYFGNCFQGESFPFPLFWKPDKNTEAGQVCVYAHFVWLAILIPSLRGWMNIKAFQIFKFWNNCERDLRAELRACISAWHNLAYSLSLCLILLLQSCLCAYFLKPSVTLVKWNMKIVFTLLHNINYWFAHKISLMFYWKLVYDKIA